MTLTISASEDKLKALTLKFCSQALDMSPFTCNEGEEHLIILSVVLYPVFAQRLGLSEGPWSLSLRNFDGGKGKEEEAF